MIHVEDIMTDLGGGVFRYSERIQEYIEGLSQFMWEAHL